MSATNHTTNYELSQFVGTDIPGWLTDYNTDMGKIDTAIKTAKDTADLAKSTGDGAETAIGQLSNLTTTDKTSVVAAINEVNTTSTSASTTAGEANTKAGTALGNANEALTLARAISSYFDFSNTGTATINDPDFTKSQGDIRYALNTAGTAGKIYTSSLYGRKNTSGQIEVELGGFTVAPPTDGQAYYIQCGKVFDSDNVNHNLSLKIEANGVVKLVFYTANANENVDIYLPPCVYFFIDFGDVVNSLS